jgi:hypothetical protein
MQQKSITLRLAHSLGPGLLNRVTTRNVLVISIPCG